MKVILFLNVFFVTCATGAASTKCEVSEMGKLLCKFSRNINSTQTDFSVYFHFNGHDELVVDCVWVDSELQCLAQQDFECKQPVSKIAEISLPAKFVNKSGTYKCVAGNEHGNAKPCQVGKIHQETQQENKNELIEFERGNHSDVKAEESFQPIAKTVLGPTLGIIAVAIVAAIVSVVVYKIRKRKRELQLKDSSPEERESIMPVERGYSSKKSNSLQTLKIPKNVPHHETL